MSDVKAIHDTALALLARREHSRRELLNKLLIRYTQKDAINQVLDDLIAAGWLSDARFAAAYIAARAARGFGPMHIRQELITRGVATDVIDDAFSNAEIDWQALASKVRIKRFGAAAPTTYVDKVKQQRFMQYRGFEAS